MFNNIILTIPHSVCISNEYHLCDYSAEKFANIFNKDLQDIKLKTYIIKSNQNRMILDDNRYSNKELTIKHDSLLWKTLRETIHDTKTIIFDIHSFPSTTKDFGDYDVGILDIMPYQSIVKQLNTYLSNNNIKSNILQAAVGHNSILDVFTLHPLYIPVLLLEINEKLNEKELENISKIITSFLKNNNIKKHYLKLKQLLIK